MVVCGWYFCQFVWKFIRFFLLMFLIFCKTLFIFTLYNSTYVQVYIFGYSEGTIVTLSQPIRRFQIEKSSGSLSTLVFRWCIWVQIYFSSRRLPSSLCTCTVEPASFHVGDVFTYPSLVDFNIVWQFSVVTWLHVVSCPVSQLSTNGSGDDRVYSFWPRTPLWLY